MASFVTDGRGWTLEAIATVGLALVLIFLLSGCMGAGTGGGSGATGAAAGICTLEQSLPTVSSTDTEQTRLEVDAFSARLRAACGEAARQ